MVSVERGSKPSNRTRVKRCRLFAYFKGKSTKWGTHGGGFWTVGSALFLVAGRAMMRWLNPSHLTSGAAIPCARVCGQHAQPSTCPSTPRNRATSDARKVLFNGPPDFLLGNQGETVSLPQVLCTIPLYSTVLFMGGVGMTPKHCRFAVPFQKNDPAIGTFQSATWPRVTRLDCGPHRDPPLEYARR